MQQHGSNLPLFGVTVMNSIDCQGEFTKIPPSERIKPKFCFLNSRFFGIKRFACKMFAVSDEKSKFKLTLPALPFLALKFKRGECCRHIQLTELQMDYTYGIVMKAVTYTLVMFVFPFLILIIVNTRIIVALKQSTNMRALHASRNSFLSKADNR